MQLKLKQGRGIEILIAHKNNFFSLSQCIILIFVKVKQLCEWEEERCPCWDCGGYRQRVGSVLSCLISPGLILLLSHPLLLLDNVCFIPALCMWHVAPRAPAEIQNLLSECQNHWEPPDVQEKRLNTFPP